MSSFNVHAKEIAQTALVRKQELIVHHFVTASLSSHQIIFFLLHETFLVTIPMTPDTINQRLSVIFPPLYQINSRPCI